MPSLRATTSKVVTTAMMTRSQPEASAIDSSSRRRLSDAFNNVCIVSTPLVSGRSVGPDPVEARECHAHPESAHARVENAARVYACMFEEWRRIAAQAGVLKQLYRACATRLLSVRRPGGRRSREAAPASRSLAAEVGGLDHLGVAPDRVFLAEV